MTYNAARIIISKYKLSQVKRFKIWLKIRKCK